MFEVPRCPHGHVWFCEVGRDDFGRCPTGWRMEEALADLGPHVCDIEGCPIAIVSPSD